MLPLLLALLGLSLLPAARAAEDKPSAQDVLQSVRLSQPAQATTLKGRLRNGGKSDPFYLTMQGSTVKYDFTGENPATLVLRLGDEEARLSEVKKGSAERIEGPRYADMVRGSDITYEDLSLRFLYWPKGATLDGTQLLLLRSCWVVSVYPPKGVGSQYGKVRLWVDKESGALMQAEAYDPNGKFARRFKVVSGQKIEGAWYLKQMRIEAPAKGRSDATPTYLEVEGLVK